MARLPRAVEEQGKRADELLKQFGVEQNQPAQPAAAQPPVENNIPAPDDPNQYVIPPDDNPTPAVQPAPEPAPDQPLQPAPQPCPECDKNKQRYSVLQGKYDAEVPRLTYRIQYLENQISDLNAQLQKANANPPGPPASASPNAPATPATSVFSEALKSSEDPAIKGFRENFPDVFAPLAKILDDFGGQITKKAEDRIASIEKTNTDTKQETFSQAIAQAHPDWQAVCQGDPRWPTWLSKADTYGVAARLTALRSASAKFDPQVVIKLLTDFKKEVAAASATNPNPAQDPNLRHVAPGSGPQGSGAAAGSGDKGPEPVARSFIQKFAREVSTGKYRGKEAEMNAIQAKIDAAVSAGKILNK